MTKPAKYIVEELPFEMVRVEGGTFLYQKGKSKYNEETITVNTFEIGKYPVTQKVWKEIMGNNPSEFKGCDDCPVECVSWEDTEEFLKKLNKKYGPNFSLPTEIEWEFAARGGNLSAGYEYAGSNKIDEVAWYDKNAEYKTHPVGQKKPNELGIYDMSGNVWEWSDDTYYDNYDIGWNEMGFLVLRGGSWEDSADHCASTYRDWGSLDLLNDLVGFRLVRRFP